MKSDATSRVLRSCLQFIAGGGITLLVSALADGLSPVASAALLAFNTLAVTVAQNFAEEKHVIPSILKPKPVGELTDATGTVVGEVVGATVEEVGEVAGTIVDEVGDVVGAVGEKEDPQRHSSE